MKNGISLVCVLGLSAGLGVAQAQTAVTPEFVMGNNDLDKDGIITREEATKAGRQLAQTWDFFDTSKDGKVDLEELKAGLTASQASGTPPPTSATPAKAPAATTGESSAASTKAAPDARKKATGAAAPSSQTSTKTQAPAPK